MLVHSFLCKSVIIVYTISNLLKFVEYYSLSNSVKNVLFQCSGDYWCHSHVPVQGEFSGFNICCCRHLCCPRHWLIKKHSTPSLWYIGPFVHYCHRRPDCMADLMHSSDYELFHKTLKPGHCLHDPVAKSILLLRPRGHDFMLPYCVNNLHIYCEESV